MKTLPYLKLLPLACAALVASCASPVQKLPVSASFEAPQASSSDHSLAGKVFSNVNQYRRSQGKSELSRHAGLDRLAQQHCEYMIKHRGEFSLYGKTISHEGFEGRVDYARAQYQMGGMAENVAALFTSKNPSAEFVTRWAASNGHNYNMLASWNCTGVGVAVDKDGTIFATQLFGSAGTASPRSMHEKLVGF